MRKSRKGFAVLQAVLAVFVVGALYIVLGISIAKANTFHIDEKKVHAQVAEKMALDGRCFSDEYGVIEAERFSQDNVFDCFRDLEGFVYLKINLLSDSYYFSDVEEFGRLANLCTSSSTLYCVEMKYPVIYVEEESEELEILTLQIISTE